MTQEEYIEILSTDLGLSRVQRNDFCTQVCFRPIKYLDEMSKYEKGLVIDAMKARKEATKE